MFLILEMIMKIIRYMYIVYNTLEVCKSICFLQTYLVTWNAIYFRKSIAFVCNGETWTYLKIASHVICGRYWFRGRIITTGSKMRAFYVKSRHLCKFTHFSCSTTNQFKAAFVLDSSSRSIINFGYSWSYFTTS